MTFDSMFVIHTSGWSAVHDLFGGTHTLITGLTISGNTSTGRAFLRRRASFTI